VDFGGEFAEAETKRPSMIIREGGLGAMILAEAESKNASCEGALTGSAQGATAASAPSSSSSSSSSPPNSRSAAAGKASDAKAPMETIEEHDARAVSKLSYGRCGEDGAGGKNDDAHAVRMFNQLRLADGTSIPMFVAEC